METQSTAQRKSDHIELAFQSVVANRDPRFYYEPMLAAHPIDITEPFYFLGKPMRIPLWVSSMTGGTAQAGIINRNLAQACGEFGMGMGLGSCRIILEDDTYFADFNVRPLMGNDAPLFANLGIAQIEELLSSKSADKISRLIDRLGADGLIVHVNPMQEWLQPEGDAILRPPLETIQELLEMVHFPVVVKEVGQGFGPESMKALLQLPIAAIDFGAHGGTNFAKLELLRADEQTQELFAPVSQLGHHAYEMVDWYNEITQNGSIAFPCREVIISGGLRDFLDGYYLTHKIQAKAVYGQAAAFLKHARGSYEDLSQFILQQIKGYRLAKTYLKIRS